MERTDPAEALLTSFSSLFIGIGFVTRREWSPLCAVPYFFQFPFHRDWLCDHPTEGIAVLDAFPFSSLFIGIGFVTLISVHAQATKASVFQFPFHRDWLCDLSKSAASDSYQTTLSVPFSSGLAL